MPRPTPSTWSMTDPPRQREPGDCLGCVQHTATTDAHDHVRAQAACCRGVPVDESRAGLRGRPHVADERHATVCQTPDELVEALRSKRSLASHQEDSRLPSVADHIRQVLDDARPEPDAWQSRHGERQGHRQSIASGHGRSSHRGAWRHGWCVLSTSVQPVPGQRILTRVVRVRTMLVRPCTTQGHARSPVGATDAGHAGCRRRPRRDACRPAQCRRDRRPGCHRAGCLRAQRHGRLGHCRPGWQLVEQWRRQRALRRWRRWFVQAVVCWCEPGGHSGLHRRARRGLASPCALRPAPAGGQRLRISRRSSPRLVGVSAQGARLVQWRGIPRGVAGRLWLRVVDRRRGTGHGVDAPGGFVHPCARPDRGGGTDAPASACLGQRWDRADIVDAGCDGRDGRPGGAGRGRRPRSSGCVCHQRARDRRLR